MPSTQQMLTRTTNLRPCILVIRPRPSVQHAPNWDPFTSSFLKMAQFFESHVQRDRHRTSITLNWLFACTARHNVWRCSFPFSSREDLDCGIWRRLAGSRSATRVMLQALECLICHNMGCATLLLLRNPAEQHSGRCGTTVGRP